jgi:hypothetical protein
MDKVVGNKRFTMNGKKVGWMLGVFAVVFLLFWVLKKGRGVIVFLFSRSLGWLILFSFVVLVAVHHYFYGVLLGLVLLLVGMLFHMGYVTGVKEGMDGSGSGYGYRGEGPWPSSLVTDFQSYSATYLPGYIYDLDTLQKQAAPWEVEALLRDGVWPWTDEVKKMYKGYVAGNWFVSVDPGDALNNAQAVYNQASIVQLMALNTKEGSFLLNGVVNGHTDGVPANKGNVVVCSADGSGMVQKKVVGYSGIWGNLMTDESAVENADLPSVVPGFQFLSGGACNPCGALGSVPDYSCAYTLNTGDGGTVSPIWKMIWGL